MGLVHKDRTGPRTESQYEGADEHVFTGATGGIWTRDAGDPTGAAFKQAIGLGEATPAQIGQIMASLGANNITGFRVKRFTDVGPTGAFLDFQSAAAASLFRVGIDGTLTLAVPLAAASGGTGLGAVGANFSLLRVMSGAPAWTAIDGVAATFTPANPAGTASATPKHMGLGATCAFTPKYSTRVMAMFMGLWSNTTINDGGQLYLRAGTGTAPVNGAAPTGTQYGGVPTFQDPAANLLVTFTHGAILTGLTIGTPYWFDLALNAYLGGTVTLQNLTAFAWEV